ncbi:MAG: YfjI family protein [Saprospiraceae bacterium]|nr:YfjI family protein [Saprospiraceae bacterium]
MRTKTNPLLRRREGAQPIPGPNQTTAKVVELIENENKFPINVFPPVIQDVIQEWHKAFGLPIEYFCSSVLSALSAVIGNSVKIKYKNDWYEPSMIYSALVGPPSSGKTPAINKAFSPVRDIEKQYWQDYKEAKKQFQQLCHEAKETKGEKPPEPHNRDLIVQDLTQEAATILMAKNPKGLVLIMDELMKFINSFDRYAKGGDMQYYLSIWSGEMVKTNRATKEQVRVLDPCLSVIGGIQTGILKELANPKNQETGLVSRFLFTIPTTFDRKLDTGYNLNRQTVNKYDELVKSLYNKLEEVSGHATMFENSYLIESNVITAILEMEPQAYQLYTNYRNEKIKDSNEASNSLERAGLGKFERICLRFALILQLCDNAANGRELKKVGSADEPQALNEKLSLQTLKKAIRLATYFENTMLSMVDRITAKPEENIISELPEKTRLIYQSLPGQFSFSDGVEIAEGVGVSRRTFTRLIKRDDLVAKDDRTGIYSKLILIKRDTDDTMTPKASN